MRLQILGAVAAGFLGLAGCAHAPTPELVAARNAYQRASSGPAARLVPAELHKSRVALTQAEEAFGEGPDSQHARDLAYVAERKAQLAEALAGLQQDADSKAKAERELQNQQAAMAQRTQRELSQTREQLADAERARAQAAQESDQQRQARLAAEQRANEAGQRAEAANQRATQAEQQARDALTKLASVKEEARGMVITLSGSVLFTSDRATLLPEAQSRLNQVADALLATKERNVMVEGYTDSRGSDDHNLELSRQRAMAVRDYLIARGYPTEHIQAVGMGKARPIADNANAEGRANNRRVEIVVQPKSA